MEVDNTGGFWDVAYRSNAPVMLGVLRRYVKDVNIAQDLLHEVFIAAIDKYASYTGKGSFEGWLHRITVNTALMYLRNERNKPTLTDTESWQFASLSATDDNDTDSEQVDHTRAVIEAAGFTGEELLAAIDRLPEHHKLVFNMYVMDDFSHRQIAAELNISQGTSKSHLARARKKIQQFLYDDALNRKKSKDRRRASAFLLLFPAKKHYIDRLYREGLSDFRLPPSGDTGFLSSAIENSKVRGFKNPNPESLHHGIPQGSTKSIMESLHHGTSFWGSKLSYMAVSCGTVVITGTACWLTMGENSPLNRDSDRMYHQDERATAGDTLMYLPDAVKDDVMVFDAANHAAGTDTFESLPEPVTTKDSKDSNVQENTGKIAPVVVKKQIIQRQSVVIRDTVFIVE